MTSRLQIALFGQPQFTLDGERFKYNALPKSLTLLAHLLVRRDSAMSRDSLAFTHWPDDSENVAIGKLRRHLHDMQKALPKLIDDTEWIIVDRDTVQWNSHAPAAFDIEEFERLGASDVTRPAAVALYRGDLLESVWDDWVLAERERLRSLCLRHLLSLVSYYGSRRNFGAAINYGERLLLLEPWREDVLRQLMSLRYESGDRAGALHLYETFTERLREDMGVEVMPDTTALRESIVANARISSTSSAAPRTPSKEPPAVEALPLVGRSQQLDQLRAAWQRAARGHGSVVFLSGEAGIGKSRLADELASFARIQGGRVLVGFTSLPERAPYAPIVDALHRGAAYLSENALEGLRNCENILDVRDRARMFELFATLLREIATARPAVIVLEDLHWSGESTIQLLEYLARRITRSPLLILATYREEEIPPEHPLRTARRDLIEEQVSSQVSLGRLSCADVVAVVNEIFPLHADGPALAERLHRQTEGHPLYLAEVILTTGDVAGEPVLDGNFAGLIGQRRRQLDETASVIAEIAAVGGDRFDVDLLCDASGWQYERVIRGTRQLLDAHLIQEAETGSSLSYTFTHNLVRATIYSDIPEKRRSQRHAGIAHLLALRPGASQSPAPIAFHFDRGQLPIEAATWYARAVDQARDVYAFEDALRFAIRGIELSSDPQLRGQILRACEDIYTIQGDQQNRLKSLESLEALSDEFDTELKLDTLLRRVHFYRATGELASESTALETLRGLVTEDSPLWRAHLLLESGLYEHERGAHGESIALLREAATLYRRENQHSQHVKTLCALVDVLTVEGSVAEASDCLVEAQRIAERSSDAECVARTLRSAVTSLMWNQEFFVAHSMAERVLAVSREMGDVPGEASAHERLAVISARTFDFGEARAHYDAALSLYRTLRSPHGLAVVLLNRGIYLTRVSKFDEAGESFAEALELFSRLKDLRGQFIARLDLGMLAYFGERFRDARTAAHEALRIARTMGNTGFEAMALANLGAAEREMGQLKLAIRHMRQGLAHYKNMQRAIDYLGDLSDLIIAYLRSGEYDLALEEATKMLTLLRESPDRPQYPQYVLWAAAWAHRKCNPEVARALLTEAHAEYCFLYEKHPDDAAKAAFAEMFFNRAMLRAWRDDVWPGEG